MANRPKRSGLCLLAGLAVLLQCEIHPASAREIDILAGLERLISPKQEVDKRAANANALVSGEASTNRNRRHSRPESQDRDQQRARTTSISEPERRRAGDMLSSGSGRQASEPLKSRASPLRETTCLMYLVI